MCTASREKAVADGPELTCLKSTRRDGHRREFWSAGRKLCRMGETVPWQDCQEFVNVEPDAGRLMAC